MLKTRIIPTLLYKNFTLVKGVGFDSWRRVGSVMQTVKIYNMREVDELVFLDVTATRENRHPDFELIDEIADECFMPLAVGGGIRSIDDVRRLLSVGADKVVIGSAAATSSKLITEIADNFGSQCVVVSVDVSKKSGEYRVYINSGEKMIEDSLEDYIKKIVNLGAGEILLTSIDRDGTMEGYDLELVKKVSDIAEVPLIVSGGAGAYEHMLSVVNQSKVSGIAAASMYHFTEQTPLEAKRYLRENGINVRL